MLTFGSLSWEIRVSLGAAAVFFSMVISMSLRDYFDEPTLLKLFRVQFLLFVNALMSIGSRYIWKRTVSNLQILCTVSCNGFKCFTGWKIIILFFLFLAHSSFFALLALVSKEPHIFSLVSYTCLGMYIFLIFSLFVLGLLEQVQKLLRFTRGASSNHNRNAVKVVLALLFTVACTIIGLLNALQPPLIKRVEIPVHKLPQPFDNLRMVLLADIHLGPTVGRTKLEMVVKMVNDLNPDIIVIVGDLTDSQVVNLRTAIEPLRQLMPKLGTYFVTGNHDYYSADIANWFKHLRTLSIRPLHNEHVRIYRPSENKNWFCLAGVDDIEADMLRYPGHGMDLKKALNGCSTEDAIVLLAHQPVAAKRALQSRPDISLVLSGGSLSYHSLFEKDLYLGAVDLRCEANNTEHHTIEIDTDRLLVRRGQEFRLYAEFKHRAFLEGTDQLAILLDTGPAPSEADGTQIQVLNSRVKWDKWTFSLQSTPGHIHLAMHSPPSACTGHYKIYLILYPSGGEPVQQIPAGDFYLLFNPWCKEDAVYLPDEDLLQEYILNENGLLYYGSNANIYPLPWNFGQFEKDVVDICFQILDNSLSALKNPLADVQKRNDPIYISRTVTAMVNANDDKGVVLGRWDGNYSSGIAPTRWTGSLPILRLWSTSGAEKVRYGQCWVFAAVACTVLRCLGIPSRCVTNYSSAHDTDGNLKVDQYYSSEDYSRMPSKRKDMVWNYHSWLESWMTRPDLPPGYDGWQVLDPTPQERSDGIYCCGPCPVRAIKEGHVDVKYDAVFIFAEVNADVVYWLVNKDGSKKELGVKQHQVGKQIITKSAYADKREDITHDYKYPEGSTKEREVYSKAGMKIRSANTQQKDLKISIKHAQPILGSDFDVFFTVANHGFMDKDVHLTLSATTVTYNGVILTEFSKRSTTFTLKAATVHKEALRLKYKHYGEHLSEHNLIRLTAMLVSKGTSEVDLKECNVALNLPQLAVKVVGEPILHKELTVQIKFANPLPITLTGGIFSVEGTGLTDQQEIKSPTAAIHPGQEIVVNVSFIPSKTGLRKLMVDFNSNRLRDVKGSTNIIVRRA